MSSTWYKNYYVINRLYNINTHTTATFLRLTYLQIGLHNKNTHSIKKTL